MAAVTDLCFGSHSVTSDFSQPPLLSLINTHIHPHAIQPSAMLVYDSVTHPHPQNSSLVSTPHTKVTGVKRPAGWSCCGALLRALIFCPSSPKALPALPAWRGAGSFLDLALHRGQRPEKVKVLERCDAYLCWVLRQLGQGGGPFSRSSVPCAPPAKAAFPALTSP